MKPRWCEEWATRGHEPCEYLGGLNDYDLWINTDNALRVTRGNSAAQWDWVYWDKKKEVFIWGSEDMALGDVFREELLEAVIQYITLFAPWALERTRSRKEGRMK